MATLAHPTIYHTELTLFAVILDDDVIFLMFIYTSVTLEGVAIGATLTVRFAGTLVTEQNSTPNALYLKCKVPSLARKKIICETIWLNSTYSS